MPNPQPEHEAIARQVVAENHYLTLATADADGTPWATPVFFAARDVTTFVWVSAPGTRHSRNLAVRPVVAITIFDSHVPIGGAEAVYVRAHAEAVPDDEVEASVALLNERLPERQHLTADDFEPAGPLRAYRAEAVELSILVRGGSAGSDSPTDTRAIVPFA